MSILLLTAGCVGGEDGQSRSGASAASPTPTQALGSSNQLSVKVTAQGNGDAASLQRATKAATPELQRFLARYLAVAFAPSRAVDPRGDLAALFDESIRGQMARDVGALSLGPAGERVSSVRMNPVTADAVLLASNGKPLASTVRLAVDGTATTEEGETPISVRSTFQMLKGGTGWIIVAYDSKARVPS